MKDIFSSELIAIYPVGNSRAGKITAFLYHPTVWKYFSKEKLAGIVVAEIGYYTGHKLKNRHYFFGAQNITK